MKVLLSLIILLSNTSTSSLEQKDAGYYMLVHRNGSLVEDHINKLELKDGQWNLFARQSDGSWQSVTCEEACKLIQSTPEDIARFTAGTALEGSKLRCVHDSAFAFCRKNLDRGEINYYLVAFTEKGSIPLKMVRLNPETMRPSVAP